LIVRDADLLADLAAGPGCTVVFSLTTLDRDLWQKLEPGTREHFLGFLRQSYPALLAECQRLYPEAYTAKRFQESVHATVAALKEDIGLRDQPATPHRSGQQLTLAL
jgi:hypothetical protein